MRRHFLPLTTVQLHMFLQVFLKVEGLSTGWLWAGEGLLVDVLVLFMVLGKVGGVRETAGATWPVGSSAPSQPHQFSLSPPTHITYIQASRSHSILTPNSALNFHDLTSLPQPPLATSNPLNKVQFW